MCQRRAIGDYVTMNTFIFMYSKQVFLLRIQIYETNSVGINDFRLIFYCDLFYCDLFYLSIKLIEFKP